MITIVEQTTNERKQETLDLFEQIKPYLDEGYNYRRALIIVGRITENSRISTRRGWFRDLIKYGASQGYNYHDYKFNRTDKIGVKPIKAYDWIHYRRNVI